LPHVSENSTFVESAFPAVSGERRQTQ